MEKKIAIKQMKVRLMIIFLMLSLILLLINQRFKSMGFFEYIHLINNGIEVTANIIDRDWTVRETKHSTYTDHYTIKYEFFLADTNQKLLKHSWVSIPEKEWEDSKITNTIRITYDKATPQINAPSTLVSGYWWGLMSGILKGMVISGFICLMIGFIMYGDIRQRGYK